MSKQALRQEMRKLLKSLPNTSKLIANEKIEKLILNHAKVKSSQHITFFYGLEKLVELDTVGIIDALLKQGKDVYLPIMSENIKRQMWFNYVTKDWKQTLIQNNFGLQEPKLDHSKSPSKIDLMILPGLAFNKKDLTRLGRGGGFYDTFLLEYEKIHGCQPYKLAIGFECQNLGVEIPMDKFDVKVDEILLV